MIEKKSSSFQSSFISYICNNKSSRLKIKRRKKGIDYFWLVYFLKKNLNVRWNWECVRVTYVTAFVPSDTACLASSPGNKSRTAVWISREEIVWRLLYCANREASLAIRSKRKSYSNILFEQFILPNISLTKLFIIDIALLEIPVSGWTWIETRKMILLKLKPSCYLFQNFVDINRICFFTYSIGEYIFWWKFQIETYVFVYWSSYQH
jgi:hypothetical protein